MQNTKHADKSPDVQISVQNFGPVAKADIDLRPLTVFVGESNTGKTYLSALIYALHQNFEGFSRFPWAVHVPLFLQSVYHSQDSSASTPTVLRAEILETLKKLDTPERPFTFSDLPQQPRAWLQRRLEDAEVFGNRLKRCFDLGPDSKLVRFTNGARNELKVLLDVREGSQTLWHFDLQDAGSGLNVGGHINGETSFSPDDTAVLRGIFDVNNPRVFLGRNPEAAYYLPAARSGIMQSHGVIASSLIENATRLGLERFPAIPAFSGMIADFLKLIVSYDEHRGSSYKMKRIAKALENEALQGEIEVIRKPVPEGYPEFLYRPKKTTETLRLSQSSSMVSELAPLVLFLRGIVKPGDLLIIEEPESHLHPDAQTAIARTLARLVREGVRLVITTHSDWLLQQLGNLIREGEANKQKNQTPTSDNWLVKEEVGTWWFHRDKPVEEISFDRIEGIEPPDYEGVSDKLYDSAIRLQQQLLEKEDTDEIE